MVLFKCHTCSANVMHKDVSKHVGKCAGPLALTCIDCKTDFFGPRYESHTRCSAPRGAEFPVNSQTAEFPVKSQALELPVNSRGPKFLVKPNSQANWIQNAKTPRKNGPKATKKSKMGTASTDHQFNVSQQLWRDAGREALKDPTLTTQQRSLLTNACKRRPPPSSKTVNKQLLMINRKLMTLLCAEDLASQLVGMIESEFKNINGPGQEEDTTKLTKNQQLIGPILRASEAPGLKPNQKSLLTSLAEDKQKQDNLLKGYVRVLWDACHHKIEKSSSQAGKILVGKMKEIRNKDPVRFSVENKVESKGNEGGKKEKKNKGLRKKGKSKNAKENNVDLQTGENGNGSLGEPVKADDSASVKSKKKRKESAEAEEEVVKNGNGTLDELPMEDDSPIEKRKSKSKKKLANVDENGSVDDVDLLMKSKKKKHRKHEENAEESVENLNGQDETPANDAGKKSKKKKLKHQDKEESVPRKKSKSTSG